MIEALVRFVSAAPQVQGVTRIAVVGSITTDKSDPKDVDVLVTVREDANFEALAALGRKLKGATQRHNRGADIFLASDDGGYIGRTCSYRDCHPRKRCLGTQCGRRKWICDDLDVINLSDQMVKEPPLEVWPTVVVRTSMPVDMANAFARGA